MASVHKTQEQERASFAWESVKKVGDKGKYKDVIRKFPSMVITNGLGNALAFLLSKGTKEIEKDENGKKVKVKEPDGGSEHGQLYLHLQEWLCDRRKLITKGQAHDDFRLMQGLIQEKSPTYRHATMEALALAGWLKRFAEALAPE